MILGWLKNLYYNLVCVEFEVKTIERINSNETFVTYLSDNED